MLERITGRYLCPITATNGQCGGFIVTDIVPKLVNNERLIRAGSPAQQSSHFKSAIISATAPKVVMRWRCCDRC